MSKLEQFLGDAGPVSTVVPAITRETFVIVVRARMFINVELGEIRSPARYLTLLGTVFL